MSEQQSWSSVGQRLAGKWQIPLLVVSLGLLVGAFLRVRPTPADVPIDQTLAFLDARIAAGAYENALQYGAVAFEQPTYGAADKAKLSIRRARARYGLANQDRVRSAQVGQRIAEDLERAEELGVALSASDRKMLGDAFRWMGRAGAAVGAYEQAIEGGVADAQELRKEVISLSTRLGLSLQERGQQLDEFLETIEDHRLDLRLWALEERMAVFEALNQIEEASTYLARHGPQFKDSDFESAYAFLEALLLYKLGHYEEAEVALRTIRNRVGATDPVNARTGWLLGRILMSDGGPQRPYDAISFFQDVLQNHTGSPYAVASRVGLAESLAMLGRHEEALAAYDTVVEELPLPTDSWIVNREVLRTSLGVASQIQRSQGNRRAAVEYARLALQLADEDDDEQRAALLRRLGQVQVELAESYMASAAGGVDPLIAHEKTSVEFQSMGRDAFADAADTFLDLSQIQSLNEKRTAEAVWSAAELLWRSKQYQRAEKVYRMFVQERPSDSLVPRALLHIGMLRRDMSDLAGAVEAFQDCYRRYPRTLDGAGALIPLTQSYLEMGPDYYELATETLFVILEDSELFTPQAPEFRDALFMLGDVLNRRGLYERAIARLEEALDRYPEDPRRWRARYDLADAYRQSALALKQDVDEATSVAEIEHIRQESTARFERARALYHEFVLEYSVRKPSALTDADSLLLRLATVYEADCLFETGNFRDALTRYEEVASVYKDTPTALSAYVQIVNCHVFLGEPEEARAALSRAQVLVQAMPQESFATSISPETRADWERYFDFLEKAELF